MFTNLSSIESAITNILSRYYPLSSKEILEKIEKISSKNCSRAGMQRALKQLIEKGVLHKNSKYYQLRTDRLIDEKQSIQQILDRYTEAQNYHIFQKQETHYFFETLSELDYFWNRVIEQWFSFYPEKRYGYWQKQPFPWFAAMHLDEERRVIRNICDQCKDFQTYCIDNVITQQLASVYEEYTNSTLFRVTDMTDISHAFAVFNDHIIETFHPPHIEDVIHELAASSSNAILFSSIVALSAPGSYKVSITRNREKAEKYRDLLLRLAY